MNAIGDFFRTAVLIDDSFDNDSRRLEHIESDEAEDLSGEPQAGLTVPSAHDQTPIYPLTLVSAFLAKNVVCSVIEFRRGSDLVKLALRSAQISDLVILDWLLFGSDSATFEAINAIAETNKGRLTVVVVFTGVPSLESVVDRLARDANFDEAGDFVLRGRADRRRPEGLSDCMISARSANSEVIGCFEADSAEIIENASSPIRARP